ncbi:hypothetical protein [Oleispirillum naphthae]|uniref:hypothetical protein n=1 Tax=Oleispirillum naphthae TaxID=2838853 RepID=UPI00308225B6
MLKIMMKSQVNPSSVTLQGLHNPPREDIDIVDLLRWAYQTQRVDEVVRRSVPSGINGGYRSNAARALETGCLGVITDGGRMGFGADGADYLPEDAERVHDAVRYLLPRKMVCIVIDYAKQGAAPDWLEGVIPRPVGVFRPNGKAEMEYRDGAKTKPFYCLLRYVPVDPVHLAFARQLYVEWWDAVARLAAAHLDLDRYRVTGPALAREPWIDRA